HNHQEHQPKKQVKESISLEIKEAPMSPGNSERGKGKAVSVEEKSGTGKVVSMSLEMSDSVSQEQVDSDNSMQIEKSSTTPRLSERDKGKVVSVEENSGMGEMVRMSSEVPSPVGEKQEGSDNTMYDSTGKQLPITFEKQSKQIPIVEENIEVRANIIFLDRDYFEEPDPHIQGQQGTPLPTVSPPANSTQGGDSQPEGLNNTKICK
ncbi:hypothetical protein MKW92_044459, partial [Papaver armeniacum]